MDTLELHLQFITSTYKIFVRREKSAEVWQNTIPRLALQYTFLLHGILAVSALHLASLRPHRQREYTVLAAEHQDLALPLFRESVMNVDEQNCHAVFAFAIVAAGYILASSQPTESLLDAGLGEAWGIVEWAQFVRNSYKAYTPQLWAHITAGPLALTIEPGIVDDPNDFSASPDDHHLTELFPLLSLPPIASAEDQAEMGEYRAALQELRRTYRMPHTSSTAGTYLPKSAPFAWILRVSSNFLAMLSERRPIALILLAHNCVLLKQFEPAWYINGLADRLVAIVYEHLNEGSRRWIEWPLEVVGLEIAR